MITFEDTRNLVRGDAIYQATGWQDNRPTSFARFTVTAVHKNSLDIVSDSERYPRHIRFNRSEFPLVYWSLAQ